MPPLEEIRWMLETPDSKLRMKALEQMLPNYSGLPMQEIAVDISDNDTSAAIELVKKCLDDKSIFVRQKAEEALKRLQIINTHLVPPASPQCCICCGTSERLSRTKHYHQKYEKGLVTQSRWESVYKGSLEIELRSPTKITYQYDKLDLNLQFPYCEDCAQEVMINEKLESFMRWIALADFLVVGAITVFVIRSISTAARDRGEYTNTILWVGLVAGLIAFFVTMVLIIALLDWLLHRQRGISKYGQRSLRVKNFIKVWFHPVHSATDPNPFLVKDIISYSFRNETFREKFMEVNKDILLI